jgi:hypothetical protein
MFGHECPEVDSGARRSAGEEAIVKKSGGSQEPSASERISDRVADLGDWRGKTLSRMRKLIHAADPDVVEEWKWAKPTHPGTPVWSHDGMICTGEVYKSVVKLTFARGASLNDPKGLFNASLDGNVRRAIDIHEGEVVDASAFKSLVRQAIAVNQSGLARPTAKKAATKKAAATVKAAATKAATRKVASRKAANPKAPAAPVRLAGGNPQIAKAEGNAPVQAFIAAMPGWQREVGRRLDALITRTVPGVRKAVKWNSPFYGVEDQGWFLSFHCFTRYVKVAFFRGTSLRPVPPGRSKHREVRYLDIHQGDALDPKQLAAWIRQAAAIPGWDGSPARRGSS